MKIGLKHIRYFIAVAEELHFRRAAERLGMAQPALSRAIQHLEQELEFKLFERTNRSVQITDAGQAFLNGSRGVINAMEHTIDDARQVHLGQIGNLRIGYTDMAIAGALPELLMAFQTKQPGVVLRPSHHVTASQLQKLDEGELDIGCVTGPINRPGYEQLSIQSEKPVCVVYEQHRLAKRKSIELKELANENFVQGSLKDWQHFYAYLNPLFRQSGFVPNVVQEAYNSAGILGLVAYGMGVTILTESVGNSLKTGLVAIPLDGDIEPLETLAVWNDESMSGSKLLFIEYLRKKLLRTAIYSASQKQ